MVLGVGLLHLRSLKSRHILYKLIAAVSSNLILLNSNFCPKTSLTSKIRINIMIFSECPIEFIKYDINPSVMYMRPHDVLQAPVALAIKMSRFHVCHFQWTYQYYQVSIISIHTPFCRTPNFERFQSTFSYFMSHDAHSSFFRRHTVATVLQPALCQDDINSSPGPFTQNLAPLKIAILIYARCISFTWGLHAP